MSRTRQDYRNEKERNSLKRRNPHNEIHREPPSTSSQEEEIERFFVIEKLLDKRVNPKTGQEEYLVKWINYSEDWNSWEPRCEIERNSADMIKNFGNQNIVCDYEQHCICRRPYKFDQGGMIQCFSCYIWFHFNCINMNMEQANQCLRFYCDKCISANANYKIIYKTRRAAIFYSTQN